VLNAGADVLDDAIPAPNAGCRMKSGATTVKIPIRSAGASVGDCAHRKPKAASSKAAKVMPME
jgi:hypothetical protein